MVVLPVDSVWCFPFLRDSGGPEGKNIEEAEFSQTLGWEDWARTGLQGKGNHSRTRAVKSTPQLPSGTKRTISELWRGRARIGERGVGWGKHVVSVPGYVLGWEQMETTDWYQAGNSLDCFFNYYTQHALMSDALEQGLQTVVSCHIGVGD